MVTDERDLAKANPDVLDFSQVTGCVLEIEEDADEEMREDKDGNSVSYNPKRFNYRYDFHITIHVNHPYFDEICFKLNDTAVETTYGEAVPAFRKPDPALNSDYMKYKEMGEEIKAILLQVRLDAREEAKAAAAPKTAVICPYCGASTIPDDRGCCEWCGGAINA